MLWVGLPAISGTNATGEMSYLDGLYRARAEKAGITYVNIWTASSMTKDATRCKGRISKARFAGCAAATECISLTPAR